MGQLATVAAYKSRKEGIEEVPTTVLDPPQERGVMAEPKIGKQKPKRNADIVARRVTRRASVGRSAPIRRKWIRIWADRTRKSATVALRRRIAMIRKSRKGANLRDET